jgi:hypothetical protein
VGNDIHVLVNNADKGDMHVVVRLKQLFTFQVGGFKYKFNIRHVPENLVSGFQKYAETLGQSNGPPLNGFNVIILEISQVKKGAGTNSDQKQQANEDHNF